MTTVKRVRYWDLAASVDGDYTCGVRMARTEQGLFYVEDVVRERLLPYERDKLILQTAQLDGLAVHIGIEEEPGSAGKSVSAALIRLLVGFTVAAHRATGAKTTRAQPLAAQVQAGNVKVVQAPWNHAFLEELHNFPEGAHDDQVDAAAGAFIKLTALRAVEVW